jgi:hypothetical protein
MQDIMNAGALATVLFLALVNAKIIDYIVKPLLDAAKIESKWILYIALCTGAALGMFVKVDLFTADLFTSPIVGKIVMAVLIGGGSNLIHDIIDRGET